MQQLGQDQLPNAANAMIGFVVLGYALYWASKRQADKVGNKAAFLWAKFPKFVLGFLLVSLLASIAFFTKSQLTAIGNLSRWAFLLTFAGVGLRTNLCELGKQGARPFLVGAIGEVAIAILTLGLSWERRDICNFNRGCITRPPMSAGGEVANALVCKTGIRGFDSRSARQRISFSPRPT